LFLGSTFIAFLRLGGGFFLALRFPIVEHNTDKQIALILSSPIQGAPEAIQEQRFWRAEVRSPSLIAARHVRRPSIRTSPASLSLYIYAELLESGFASE